jgi:hypothetical protein
LGVHLEILAVVSLDGLRIRRGHGCPLDTAATNSRWYRRVYQHPGQVNYSGRGLGDFSGAG